LEKADNQFGLPTDGKTKEQQLAQAALSTSTAQRYEELAGPVALIILRRTFSADT
jgi:hypothetical protein